MLDLGLSFLASVARDPDALAIVDGDMRLTYAQWYRRISAVVAGFDAIGLSAGDHLVTALTNRWEAATLHWACQFAGIIITPVNWRSTADEIDFYLDNAEAKALAYEDACADAVSGSAMAQKLPRIALDTVRDSDIAFADLASRSAPDARACADAESWSVMLYTSGTTARPKGVPRRQRAERAAALAHVAQNLYAHGERTLGVMPLYHTMGVRSLLAMSLIGGAFVCLRRFDVESALGLIDRERVTNLYLVPTLYHDLVHHPLFASSDVSSVRKLGFAGAPMTDGLLKTLQAAFKPDLFVNHYGSSEVYTFTIDQNALAKPGSAGRAGINQMVRVVKLGARTVDDIAAPGEEGEIIALLAGDESFEGYWRRPEADSKALREGWYFTGDTGFVDNDGDLFVTGRVDDMIITGGENVSPVEIESCLSLHAAVSEVAVVGLPDERWGKIVTAFIKRRARSRSRRSRRLLPQFRPRQLQAAAPLRLCRRDSEIAGRKTASPQARRRRISNLAPLATRNCRMSEFSDPRLQKLDGFRVEIDAARERADIVLDRPPLNVIEMAQRDQLRLVFEALDEDARVRVIVLRRQGRAFFLRRQYRRLPCGVARARLEAGLEYRRAGALFEAGDRRQSRLLLRRRFRDFAGLRFPPRFRNLPIRAAGTAARPDSGLRRLGPIAEDHRHHPDQRHRHALEAHCGEAGLRLGHRHRMRAGRQARGDDRRAG